MADAARAKHLPMAGQHPVSQSDSKSVVTSETSNEYVFGVVGHIGSGTTETAKNLETKLKKENFEVVSLKARTVISKWATLSQKQAPTGSDGPAIKILQDLGDEMRKVTNDYAAVARGLVDLIRRNRAEKQGMELESGKPVEPDGKKRAYVLDSIRHPSEVYLLRHVYGDAFALIGVVCTSEDHRVSRLTKKLNVGDETVKKLMQRDAHATEAWGQRVSDAFHLADAFLDNSDDKGTLKAWRLPDEVARFVSIVVHSQINRPTMAEVGMFVAHGSQLQSACLSRQVGAAILGSKGDVLAIGTNEAPRAGGGVYSIRDSAALHLEEESHDGRCAFSLEYCSSTREQKRLITSVVAELTDAGIVPESSAAEAEATLAKSDLKRLLEFSRAIHAEMDALISAGRKGASLIGGTAYVTTFPCHYCARHLVSAGLDAVFYIEPYPKSRALELHEDSITTQWEGWTRPSDGGHRVLFAPFTGVAPRMYERAFLKNRPLKDKLTGTMRTGDVDYVGQWHLRKVSYTELEAKLSDAETN